MDDKDSEFFKELVSMFKMEAKEHLDTISSGLPQLEKTPHGKERTEILETIFRAAHSLKGAARTVGLVDIEPIGQSLEKLFSIIKQKDANISSALSDTLYQITDTLGELIFTMDEQGKLTGDKSSLTRLIDEVNENIVIMEA